MKKTILSLASLAFVCAMTLTSCDEIMSTIDNPVGSYVQFNDSVLNLTPGQVAQNVATTISTEKVTYTSSDKSIATVDPNGFVTAIAFGEATITASVPANENYQAGSASYKVKVGSVLQKALKNGADVEIVLQDGENKIAPKFLNENNVFTLQNPLAGANSTLTYDKAKNLITFTQQVVVFPTSQTVITVIFDVTKNTYQAIPALSTTTAQFAAIKIYGDDVTGKVTKKEVAAEAVTITGAPTIPFIMAVGDADVTLKADVTPVEATDKKVTWSSSAPAVATIDETGKVHAVAAGTTTIKATTANGKEASIELTVNLPKATVTTPPTAKTGIKAGEDKTFINAGVASGGTMRYALTTTNKKPTSTFLFGSTVPSAKNRAAGTYYVWYYVKADATHVDSDIAGPVSVTIQSAVIALSAVTTADIKKIVTTDGYVYASTLDVPTGKTAAAKIAYVSSTGHGLALALADESGFMQWFNAKTACSGHTPAVSGRTWSLPTKDQWTNMMTTAGNYDNLRANFGLEAGDNAYYWSITEDNFNAWVLMGPLGQWISCSKELSLRARAVLVF